MLVKNDTSPELNHARSDAFSRRDFFKLSAAAVAGAAAVPGLTGCGPVQTPSGCLASAGAASYVSMRRPFIIEPDIVNRFRKEAHAKSECINCGHCIMAANNPTVHVKCFYRSL